MLLLVHFILEPIASTKQALPVRLNPASGMRDDAVRRKHKPFWARPGPEDFRIQGSGFGGVGGFGV